jgi:O-antigen ligase
MSGGHDESQASAAGSSALVIAFLAVALVGLHLLVDPAAYDVSQMVRLVAVFGVLVVGVPALFLLPPRSRLDVSVLAHPIVVASAAYLVACVASLAWALNVSAGLTDCFRTLAAFFVLCLTTIVLPLDPRWKRWLLETATVALLVAVVVGGSATLPLVLDGFPSRRAMEEAFLDGLMSNVNLFASWLVLLVPWCLCGTVVLVGRWRGVAGAVATVGLLLVVVLQSRAAWAGCAVSGIVTALVLLRYHKALAATAWVCRSVTALLAGGIALGLILLALAFTETPLGNTIRDRVITRPHQAAGPTDGGRTVVWGITGQMIADAPLMGVGAGNFTVRLHEYLGAGSTGLEPDLSSLSSDNWIQPHNDFLWVVAEKGVVGFISFIAIFVCGIVAAWSVLRRGTSVTDARLALASFATLVAYLVVSFFDFPLDRVSHQVVIAVHLGVLVLLEREGRPPSRARPLAAWLVLPPVLAACILGLSYATAAWRQEREVILARRAQHDGDWLAMRDAARRGTTPWKTLDPLAVPVSLLEGLAEVQLGNLPAATACFERAYAANPNRLAVLQNLGAAYAQGGLFDEAVAAFAIAANRYPDRIEVRHNLASALLDAGRFTEAIAVIEDIPEPLRPQAMQESLDEARDQAAALAP